MSDNLKFAKGNEIALPVAAPDNAGTIYHCDDTHNTYLDDGAVLQPFASAVGRTYIDEADGTIGGEIFGDYENNIATGENSEAHGTGTQAGSNNQAIFGKYNANDANNIFEIGIGTSADNTKNGLSLSVTGDLTVARYIRNKNYNVMPLDILLQIDGTTGAITFSQVTDLGSNTVLNSYTQAGAIRALLLQNFNTSTITFQRPIIIKIFLSTMVSNEFICTTIEYELNRNAFVLKFIDYENSQIIHIWLLSQKNCLIETYPFTSQSILSGTTEPTADIGEDGDLYIMPYNTRIPVIYSGTTIPTSAIGVDGDIYVLYEA